MTNNPSRREFIKLAAGTGLAGHKAATVLRAAPPPQVSANDRIRLATIGIGGQGTYDTTTALRVPGVELVAAADVYDGRLVRANEVFGASVQTTRDYREVLARSDVDAVIIATPDHWHAQVSIDAMNAGKDVYCEKPMVQTIADGHRVIDAERRTKRIFQVGSQRVSSVIYAKARDLMKAGAIGELNLVEAWWDRNSPVGAWQYTLPADASPATVDWDRFLGQAPKRPFEPIRLFRWRNYRDYGTGVAGDLFVHLFSGMHFIVGALGPTRVMSTGGLRFWNDGRDVPDVMLGLYDYPRTPAHPAFTLALKVNFVSGEGENSGLRFVGSEGILTIGDEGVTLAKKGTRKAPEYTIGTFPLAAQEAFLREYQAKYPDAASEVEGGRRDTYAPPSDYSDSLDHFTNFFQAVRSRKAPVEDSTFGLRAAGPALVSNQSYFEGKPIAWNPDTMAITTA